MKWRGPFGGGAASGAAGSFVASHARGTQYLRARTVPVNIRSPFQQGVRNAVKALTSLWQALTEEQRGAWRNYGLNVTTINTLGDAFHASGINWFVGNNTPRVQAGLAATLDGPTIFDRGNPDWSSVLPDVTILTDGTVGTLTTSAAIEGNNAANGALLLYISRPYSPGITSFNGPTQLAATFPSNASGNILAGSFTFNSPFVASGVSTSDSGNQMSYTLRLDRGDGRLSSKFQGTVTG